MACLQVGKLVIWQVGKFTGWQVGRIVESFQVDKLVCCNSDRLQGLQVAIILGWQVGRVGILTTCKMLGWHVDILAGYTGL